MHLGCFSVSLSVKDLAKSRAFYEALGFEVSHDASEHHYCIMRQGDTLIGLYHGMFEGNILTFNPGWGQDAQAVDGAFEDVRAVQERLRAAGLDLIETADPEGEGVAHITLKDPDGNAILIDQHVPKP